MTEESDVHGPGGGDGRPVAYLLVGLTGSGKTTYALHLQRATGVVRLSVDEEMAARHGRYGVDYPHQDYLDLERPVVAELTDRLRRLLADGRSVVLDHGLWRREARDRYKKLVEDAGGRWRLLHFDVPRDELLRRLDARNRRDDANALPVSPTALNDFHARYDPPRPDEGAEPPPPL